MDGVNIYNLLDRMTPGITSDVTEFLKKYGSTKSFTPGEILIRQGTVSQTVYILMSGTVEILKSDSEGRKSIIATAEKGAIFGEMSIFLNLRRSATIRAQTPGIVLEFTNQNFLEAVVHIPFLTLRVIKSLCTKLTELNERYVKEVDCNNILFIGLHILDETDFNSHSMQQVQVDTVDLGKKASIAVPDVIVVLNKMKAAGVIDKLNFDTQKKAHFQANPKALKNYMKSLAFKPA